MNTLFRAKSRADGAPPCCYCCKAPFSPARAGAKERHLTGCRVNRGKFLQQPHESYLHKSQPNQKEQSRKLFLFPIIAIISRQR